MGHPTIRRAVLYIAAALLACDSTTGPEGVLVDVEPAARALIEEILTDASAAVWYSARFTDGGDAPHLAFAGWLAGRPDEYFAHASGTIVYPENPLEYTGAIRGTLDANQTVVTTRVELEFPEVTDCPVPLNAVVEDDGEVVSGRIRCGDRSIALISHPGDAFVFDWMEA